MIESPSMVTLWRRHTARCAHREKGRSYLKCNCPVWADGYVNGRRTLRVWLETRDLAARKKAAALESPDESVFKAVADSVKGFIEHCQSEGLKDSTISKYRNVLGKLVEFCELSGSTA